MEKIETEMAQGNESASQPEQSRQPAEPTYEILDNPPAGTPTENKGHTTHASVLLQIVNNLQLFHTTSKECFAVVNVNGHYENHSLDSKEFGEWLSKRYWESEKQMPSKQAVEALLTHLGARARFESPCEETHIRVAEYDDQIFIDLGDDDWRAVRVTKDGWKIIESVDVPVRFRRSGGMRPLPIPEEGGSLEELRHFINVEERDFILILAWLVNCLRPNRPFPILSLNGEHGSAKSTTSEALRSLIDPNSAPLRSVPRNEENLAIAAHHSWMLVFDNLSGMSSATSDALCRVSTGGGLGTRQLYTNAGEFLFNAKRPILLNGINEVTTRPDLLDRSLIIHCPTIPAEMRKTEDELDQDFAQSRPRIFGALLRKVAEALRNLQDVTLPHLPRMADFARFGTAAFGDEFITRYLELRAESNMMAIESSAVGTLILQFMADREQWEGRPGELLNELRILAGFSAAESQYFPKQPNKLSRELNRLAPNLRAEGIDVRHRGQGVDRRNIILEKLNEASSRSSHRHDDDRDDRDDKTQSLDISLDERAEDEIDEGEVF